jgi:fructan beta-fructosidase
MRFILFIAVATLLSNCQNKVAISNDELNSDSSLAYRPEFHFAPQKNWINDPNGLVYYNGDYHLFFQYNPFGATWGHMSWGHAVSKDLIKWEELDVAIPETHHGDKKIAMAFSGTAFVDSFNSSGFAQINEPAPLIAIYTTHVTQNDSPLVQHQSMVYSLDGRTFNDYDQNPVLDIGAKDFRDPKIFKHERTGKWIMIVAKPDEYKVHFYSSENLKNWKFLSAFGPMGNVDKIWECPDIFELPVTNAAGEKKWVLTLSAGHPEKDFLGMQYFIGEFNGTSFKPDPLSYPLYIDHGKDFYAGIIYNNLPSSDTRKIMVGWANSWVYADKTPTKVFRGMMAIPRELSLQKTGNGYSLLQQPVRELDNYFGETIFENKSFSLQNNINDAGKAKANIADIQFTMSVNGAEKAGIKVLKSGDEETMIYYDSKDKKVKIDRTRSGNVSFHEKFGSIESVPVVEESKDLTFRILIDKSIVEVFVNDGKYVLTDLVFPTKNEGGFEFFSTQGGSTSFKNVVIRKLKK